MRRPPSLRLGMLANPAMYSMKDGEVGTNFSRRPRWRSYLRDPDYSYTSRTDSTNIAEFYNSVFTIRPIKPAVRYLPLYTPYRIYSDYKFIYQASPQVVATHRLSNWGGLNKSHITVYKPLGTLGYTQATARALYNDWNALWAFLTNTANVQTAGLFSELHARKPQARAAMCLGNRDSRFTVPGLPTTVEGVVYKGTRALIDWFRTYNGNTPETDMPDELRHLMLHNIGLYCVLMEQWGTGSNQWYARGTMPSPASAHPNAMTVNGEPIRLLVAHIILPITTTRDANGDFLPDLSGNIQVVFPDFTGGSGLSWVVRPCGIPNQNETGESNWRAIFDPRTTDPIGETVVRLFAERIVEFYTNRVAVPVTIDGQTYLPESNYPWSTELEAYTPDIYGDYTYDPARPQDMPLKMNALMFDTHGPLLYGYTVPRLPQYGASNADPYRTLTETQLNSASRIMRDAAWRMECARAFRNLRQALLAINPYYTRENLPFELNSYDIPELDSFTYSAGYNPSTHKLPADIQTGELSSDADIETALNRFRSLFQNATNATDYLNAIVALKQWATLYLLSQIQGFTYELPAYFFSARETQPDGRGEAVGDVWKPPSDAQAFDFTTKLITNPSYTPAFLNDFFTNNEFGRKIRLVLGLGKELCYMYSYIEPRSNRVPYRMRRAAAVRLSHFMANLPDGLTIRSDSLPGIHSSFYSVFPLTVSTTGWSKRFICGESRASLARTRERRGTSPSNTVASVLYHMTNRFEPYIRNTPLAHEPLPDALIQPSRDMANPPSEQGNENPDS